MKTILSVLLLCCAAVLPGSAQLLQTDTMASTAPVSSATAIAAIPPTPDGYLVTEIGANYRRWACVTAVPDARGRLHYVTNSYVELQDDMYHIRQGASGPEWAPSHTVIEAFPGGAVAQQGEVQMIFANDLATAGAIDAQTPAGRFRSQIVGLSYADPALQTNILIAQVKSCQGQIIAPNQVIYPDALVGDGFTASVRYTYRSSGWEQDVLIEDPTSLVAPEAYGLNSSSPTLALQVITEFLDPPVPALTSQVLTTDQGAVYQDDQVDWGLMKLQSGKAFFLGQPPDTKGIPVLKRWLDVDSRHVLIEEVPFTSFMKALLSKDQGASLKERATANRRLASLKSLPVLPTAKPDPKPMQVAKAPPLETGILLDYSTISATQSNYLFAADSTYYVSGTNAVNLNGTTTMEGGAVIKLTNCPTTKLCLNGRLLLKTAQYRPVVLTSWTDNSMGQSITGSSGNPSNVNGATYLQDNTGTNTFQQMRFLYAGIGLSAASFSNGIWHCQFLQCGTAINTTNTAPVVLRNVLIVQCTNAVAMTVRGTLSAEHLTADKCTTLLSGARAMGNVTNSLISAVATLGNVTLYSSPQFTSGAGVYQPVGAGSYYLCDGSTNRNAGLTNINPTLANSLSLRTTYPPLVCSNVVISSNTTLAPQAQRDTDLPDLGYHYDPLDYAFSGVQVTNATLQLTTGTAIAAFGSNYGLGLLSGSQLICVGSPTNLNRIVRFNAVQEGSSTNWNGSSISVEGDWLGGPTPAQAFFRFTDWSMPAQDGYHFSTSSYTITNTFRDCQFHGGELSFSVAAFTFTNSLLERANTTISDVASMSPFVRNCLFHGGQFVVSRSNSGSWSFRDSLFDAVAITDSGDGVDAAYNGFTTNTVNNLGGSSNQINLVPDYQTGPLGSYYYPTNGGSYSLTNLINTGSTWATNVGLYHFTTTTNQVKEGSTMLDIGFHYVAVDASGNPQDYDGDGLPDYLEDVNGDGSGANDPTSWLIYNSPNGLIPGSGLKVFTPLK